MTTHDQAQERLDQHFATCPICRHAGDRRIESLCPEGRSAYDTLVYELQRERRELQQEPVSADEVLDVHQRLDRLERLDELLE